MKNRKFCLSAPLEQLLLAGFDGFVELPQINQAMTRMMEIPFKITTVSFGRIGGKTITKVFLDDSAKESGIKIKWDTMVAADWSDKKSVLVASGDFTRRFSLGSNAFTDSEIAQNQNMFIPLEDFDQG